MNEAQVEANKIVAVFMGNLVEHMVTTFPHHANALRNEFIGTKLNENRWHRIEAILASLHSIPGVELLPAQHDVRNICLASVVVATKMATACFGSRDPEADRELALWCITELQERINRNVK